VGLCHGILGRQDKSHPSIQGRRLPGRYPDRRVVPAIVAALTTEHYPLMVMFAVVFAGFANEIAARYRLFGLDIAEIKMWGGEIYSRESALEGKEKIYFCFCFCLVALWFQTRPW
jgi:hypothetical protein